MSDCFCSCGCLFLLLTSGTGWNFPSLSFAAVSALDVPVVGVMSENSCFFRSRATTYALTVVMVLVMPEVFAARKHTSSLLRRFGRYVAIQEKQWMENTHVRVTGRSHVQARAQDAQAANK